MGLSDSFQRVVGVGARQSGRIIAGEARCDLRDLVGAADLVLHRDKPCTLLRATFEGLVALKGRRLEDLRDPLRAQLKALALADSERAVLAGLLEVEHAIPQRRECPLQHR